MLEDLQLRFTDNEISPWGGLTLLFKMPEKCNMKEALATCPPSQTRGKPWLLARTIDIRTVCGRVVRCIVFRTT